jgi:MFS superfamily sulfate permease-like transporter
MRPIERVFPAVGVARTYQRCWLRANLIAGVLALVAGLARLGFLADFVSKPILPDYIVGAAFIMISSQPGKLFGINIAGNKSLQRIWGLLTHLCTIQIFPNRDVQFFKRQTG